MPPAAPPTINVPAIATVVGGSDPFATLVSGNAGKIAEVEAALGQKLPNADLKVPEVQPSRAVTALMENGQYEAASESIARDKAIAAFRMNGFKPVLVEDTGLYFHGVSGLPGPLIAHHANSPEKLRDLCGFIGDKTRKATAIVSFAFYDGTGEPQIRSSEISGEIALAPRGNQGFGWDSIFIPEPERQRNLFGADSALRTFAEMTADEKAQFSMRVRALTDIRERPFEAHMTPGPVIVDSDLAGSFFTDMKARIQPDTIEAMRRQQQDHWSAWRSRLQSFPNRDTLVQTGELPVVTPYDVLSGDLVFLADDQMAQILAERHFDIERQTHPATLEAQLAMERRGFIPVTGKQVAVFDDLLTRRVANAFDDFALSPRAPREEGDPLDEHTLLIRMAGLMSWTSKKMVTPINNGSSMPCVIGAFSMATLGLLGSMSFAPADSKWQSAEAQIAMIKRAREIVAADPTISDHCYKDHVLSNGRKVSDHLIERANRVMGATIKADKNAITNAEKLFAEGVTLFRVYDAGSTKALINTVETLRKRFGESITILAGQVLTDREAELLANPDRDPRHAAIAREEAVAYGRRLVAAGADGLIVGIGDGELCSTSTAADISGDNAKVGYEFIRANIEVPVIFDGGVGNKTGVAVAIGGAGRLSSRGLIGGTIEQPPLQWFTTSNGEPAKNYRGEAGSATKHSGGMLDYLGRPLNVEGVNGYVTFDKVASSIAYRMSLFSQAFAKALRFQRLVAAEILQHLPKPPVVALSPSAALRANPHHENHSR